MKCGCPYICYKHHRWGRLFNNISPVDGTPDPLPEDEEEG